MNGICILGHLGLGAHIVQNAIYRWYAARHDLVCIPVKYHNVPSVQFMLRDLDNVVIRPVEDDVEAIFFYNEIWKGEKKGLGGFGESFDGRIWDQEFFRESGVPFQLRWDGWTYERDLGRENQRGWPAWGSNFPHKEIIFLHDDPSRGILIDHKYIHQSIIGKEYLLEEPSPAIVRPDPSRNLTIFDYRTEIEKAKEIHCICSSFALFIDSIDLPQNPKLFLHAYARPGEALPQFKQNWEILK